MAKQIETIADAQAILSESEDPKDAAIAFLMGDIAASLDSISDSLILIAGNTERKS